MNKILFANEFGFDLLTDMKRITIRKGHRDFKEGEIVGTNFGVLQLKIISCRNTRFKDITEEEWTDDGFESQQDMMEQMQRFYPNMKPISDACVIRFRRVTNG